MAVALRPFSRQCLIAGNYSGSAQLQLLWQDLGGSRGESSPSTPSCLWVNPRVETKMSFRENLIYFWRNFTKFRFCENLHKIIKQFYFRENFSKNHELFLFSRKLYIYYHENFSETVLSVKIATKTNTFGTIFAKTNIFGKICKTACYKIIFCEKMVS